MTPLFFSAASSAPGKAAPTVHAVERRAATGVPRPWKDIA